MNNNEKTLYNLVTAIVVLSVGMFCSCSEDNEGFITATEDDFPQILLPWFGDWENGEPAVYKSISRDAEFIDSTVVTPALYTTVEWFLDDEKYATAKDSSFTASCRRIYLEDCRYYDKGKTDIENGQT